MASQGFFDYGDNFGEQIASNFGDYTIEDKKNVINFQKKLRDDPTYTPKPYESESLRRQLKAENETFSPRDEDTAFLNKFIKRADEKFIKTYERKQEGEMENSDFETEKYKKLKEKYGDEFSSNMRSNYSPIGGGVNVARADTGGLSEEENYKAYLKLQGIRYPRTLPDIFHRLNRQNMREDIKELKYKDGQFLNKAEPTEEKGNILQRIAGSIFDAVTGTQPVSAQPTMSTFSETGDPSFRAYRMGQDFADSIRGIGNLPSDYKATEEAAFRAAEKFRDAVSGMSNLPSDYKATEAAAFKAARNFKEAQSIAKRNPNVSINSDGKAVATNNSARARAQAAAVNRKLSGKSMSQVKSENKQAMRDKAKARHAAFKKKRAEKKKNKKK